LNPSSLKYPRRLRRPHVSDRTEPLAFISVTEISAPMAGSESVSLNRDTSYLGEPAIQSDGTEGNGAYYQGNYLPTTRVLPKQHQKYWRNSPYWNYFRSIWGGAPMADENFELWLRGYFKDFTLPRHPQDGQTTRGLPAWLHYYNTKYDPLLDPPYESDFSLFGEDAGGETMTVPAEAGDPLSVMGGEAGVYNDCSEWRSEMPTIDRPCTKRSAQRHMVRPYKKGQLHYFGGLDMNLWTDKRNMAGKMAGSESEPGRDEELNKQYIKMDKYWAAGEGEGDESQVPLNIPKQPKFVEFDGLSGADIDSESSTK